jgi:hypothetical protein
LPCAIQPFEVGVGSLLEFLISLKTRNGEHRIAPRSRALLSASSWEIADNRVLVECVIACRPVFLSEGSGGDWEVLTKSKGHEVP